MYKVKHHSDSIMIRGLQRFINLLNCMLIESFFWRLISTFFLFWIFFLPIESEQNRNDMSVWHYTYKYSSGADKIGVSKVMRKCFLIFTFNVWTILSKTSVSTIKRDYYWKFGLDLWTMCHYYNCTKCGRQRLSKCNNPKTCGKIAGIKKDLCSRCSMSGKTRDAPQDYSRQWGNYF